MPLKEMSAALSTTEQQTSRDALRVYEMIAGQWVSSSVRALATLGIVDSVLNGSTTVAQIAADTGCAASGVARLLRVSRSLGLIDGDEQQVGVTSTGRLLGSDTPGSLRALAELQGTPGVWALWGALPDSVRAGRSVAPQLLEQPFFDYLGQNPDEAETFGSAMRDLTGLVEEDARRVVDLAQARTVVDVGGGTGSFLAGLLDVNPSVSGIVLDTEHVVPAVHELAQRRGLGGRLTGEAGDFLRQIPAADYYILKLVLHDWDDEDCVRILTGCRTAAHAGSRLLVVEAVIDDRDHGDATADLGTLMDMTILTLMNGRERELREYDALFAATGWARGQVVQGRSIYSFIELVPTDPT